MYHFLRLVAVTVSGAASIAMPVTRRQRRRPAKVERMYSPDEVSALLGVGRTRVFELIRSGDLSPTLKLSHKVRRIPESAVRRYLESLEV